MSRTGYLAAFVAALLAVGAARAPAVHAETFVFTAIPDQDESRLRTRFGKVADYLKGKLGVDVRYIPVKSYAAAVTAFRNDQVQLAWFGGLSGVQARARVPGSVAIAQGKEDLAFVTYFIAHASTGLTESKDLPKAMAGKTFTFGSKGSTSGRLMPEFHIRNTFGKAPEQVLSRVGFSGDHSRTIALVQSGSYQIGATNYQVWETELKEGKIDPKRVRVIWKTPAYPDYQWTIRGDADKRFGKGFTDKVRQALLTMNDPELLKSFPRSAFVPATNKDYEPIEKTAKAIGIID
jgi:phosphonate transport system substrate-binding protein